MIKKLYIKRLTLFMALIIFTLSFTGCNAFKKQEASQPNYKELKQMVLDILQTEDGKKAIQETMSDDKVKSKLVLNDGEVVKIVQDELLSEKSMDKLKKMYEDPKFAKDLAEALKKQNEKLLKDLMKDPEYRKMLIETMDNKEFEKIILDVMKSNEYRTQMMMVMKESLESPMFKYDLLKLMEEASKKALEPENDSKDKGKEGEQGGDKNK